MSPKPAIRTDIHLCKGCGDELQPGEKVVDLSDGYVTEDETYDVNNRRLYHQDCWLTQPPEDDFDE